MLAGKLRSKYIRRIVTRMAKTAIRGLAAFY